MCSRSWRLCAGALLLALCATHAAGQGTSDILRSEETTSPNVLILLADDFMFAEVGLENAAIETPNLDRLAKQGVRFTRYAVNHPVCSPSRATLLTGLYAPIH